VKKGKGDIFERSRVISAFLVQLPEEERQNFFGDRFTFAIDEIDDPGRITEKIAGANNICAAQATFDEYLHHITRSASYGCAMAAGSSARNTASETAGSGSAGRGINPSVA
jgi:hypothetical protein